MRKSTLISIALGGFVMVVGGLHSVTKASVDEPATSTASVTPAAPERPKVMTIEEFKVDGATLATTKAKVRIRGFYTGSDDGGYLVQLRGGMPINRDYSDLLKIGVLDNDAPRDTRLELIKCRAQHFNRGCMITVVGQTTTCSWTNAFGVTRADTCIEVEDTILWE